MRVKSRLLDSYRELKGSQMNEMNGLLRITVSSSCVIPVLLCCIRSKYPLTLWTSAAASLPCSERNKQSNERTLEVLTRSLPRCDSRATQNVGTFGRELTRRTEASLESVLHCSHTTRLAKRRVQSGTWQRISARLLKIRHSPL